MGLLVDGKWIADEPTVQTAAKDGQYRRADSVIRSWVTADGSAGPSGEGGFPAAKGRYHIYVAINCPWAHRTMIFRLLKGLSDVISMSYVLPRRDSRGWIFDNTDPDFVDHLFGKNALHEIYQQGHPDYTGRVTVPVLWDKERGVIVNNESSEIIRMLNTEFAAFTDDDKDYYPEAARAEIDSWNERIYATVNNGVYRTGFAKTQEAYETSFDALFDTLDALDQHLGKNRYIAGDQITEADWRLFPTLVRFDSAYYGAFKCNLRRLMDYPNLWPYTRELFQVPGIGETVHPQIYKAGYYSKSAERNPSGIVPKGPIIDFTEAHGRGAT